MKIKANVELLMTLGSKEEWVSRVPRHLPEKANGAERWIWLDKNGNFLTVGADFSAAEKMKSYPVRIYRQIRVNEALTNKQK